VPKPEADAFRILSEIKHTNVALGKKIDNLKVATPVTADVLESVTRKKRQSIPESNIITPVLGTPRPENDDPA